MPTSLELVVVGAYAAALFMLSLFSANRYVMISLFRKCQRAPRRQPRPPAVLPRVTVQLPIYNELLVAERVIRSACRLDYPRELLQIQVLDDSTDETLALTREVVRRWRARGIPIEHIHRAERTGYKAGALAYGLARASGDLVAVFDADFVIPRDFLRRTVPHFDDPHVGVVQTRWAYLNERYSLLTRVNALGLSGQFVIEQPARDFGGLFLTFNGTAGIWRTRAIRDAGGWHDDTLTEDLDLSYRAQLAGWRIRYLSDVTCPSELPPDMHALKTQQFRWTKGSQETARKLLATLWRAAIPRWQKLQGSVHLLGNSVYPFLLLVGVLNPLVMWIAHHDRLKLSWPISLYFLASLFGTFAYYAEAMRTLHADWRRRMSLFPLFLAASLGLSVYNAQAAIEGLLGRRSPFVRTPKYALDDRRGRVVSHRRSRGTFTASTGAELLLGAYTLAAFIYAAVVGEWGALPFLALFATGYLLVGGYSLARTIEPRVARSAGRAVAALLLFVLFVRCDAGPRPAAVPADDTPDSMGALPSSAWPDSMALVAKDAHWIVLPAGPGVAHGTFRFGPDAGAFDWQLSAYGLAAGRAYRVELAVDGQPFDIASTRADASGTLHTDGRLTAFADRTCVGDPRPAMPVTGTHTVGVVVKNDGAAPGGDAGGGGPVTGAGGDALPCSGNGDGDFTLRLAELSAARFSAP